MPETDYEALSKKIVELKDEQRRLREEQERLRQQASSNGHGTSTEANQDGQPHRQQQPFDNGSQGRPRDQQQKPEGDQKEPDGKSEDKEKKEEPKPPLKQRVQTFVQTHKKQLLIGAIIFVIACVAAVFLLLYLSSYESTDDAEVDGHLNAISPRVMGTVQNVCVEDNQTVNQGQLLVELDPRDLQNALAQARASYSTAEAQLKAQNPSVPIEQTTNASSIATNESGVANAQAGVLAAEQEYQSRLATQQQAEANDAKAQRDLIRYRGLVEKAEISREQYDTYVAAAKTEAAGVVAAQASAAAAQKQIDQTRAQLLQAQTRLDESKKNAPRSVLARQADVQARQAALLSAQAQADQAALNLSYAKIYAPVSGVVTNKTVEVGQRLEPGEQMFIISQIEDIWITANFKETQLKKMHAGQHVDIHVDTYGRTYHGYIESMPGATGARTSLLPPENATGNYVKVVQRLPVRIRLNQGENNDHLLRPGMSVEPKVWLK